MEKISENEFLKKVTEEMKKIMDEKGIKNTGLDIYIHKGQIKIEETNEKENMKSEVGIILNDLIKKYEII